MYRHILWDFDGTLFDSYPVMAGIFKDELKRIGHDEPLDEIMAQMQVSMSHAVQYYESKYGIDKAFLKRYKEQRNLMETKHCMPFKEIVALCKHICESGRKNYLYTHRGSSAIDMLKLHGLYEYFTDFVTDENGFERKPSPDAINYLIQKNAMNPKEALMVGDRDLDIISAKNAGIDGCYFNQKGVESIHADHNISDFNKLYDLI